MPAQWKDFLGSGYMVMDSIKLSQIDFLNDTTFMLVQEIPEIIQKESFVNIGADSLLIVVNDTILKEIYDTIPVGKNNSLRMLKEIAKRESLDISDHLFITDLYPVDQMTDLKTLNIEPVEHYPAATDHVPEMIALIRTLIDRGVAYRSDD
ncbi:MAG: hypothetical protein HGA23_05565, partial [Bacteroidales bacterium]|nr:hypothetical protein [Bacteroidales bacterium]